MLRRRECAICFEEHDTWYALTCGHLFCKDCAAGQAAACHTCGKEPILPPIRLFL